MSTSPLVAGLIFLDSSGGQFIIMFLYISECLKRTKTGREASMASMMGASKPGALMASTDVPKQRMVITSIVMQRKAQKRSAGVPALLWRLSAVQSALIYFDVSLLAPITLRNTHLFYDKTLCLLNRLWREHFIKDIFSLLRFLVGNEAEGGPILAEAVVEPPFFVPAVLVVVDVVVGLRIREVQLAKSDLLAALAPIHSPRPVLLGLYRLREYEVSTLDIWWPNKQLVPYSTCNSSKTVVKDLFNTHSTNAFHLTVRAAAFGPRKAANGCNHRR
jgi:hypothetical protein